MRAKAASWYSIGCEISPTEVILFSVYLCYQNRVSEGPPPKKIIMCIPLHHLWSCVFYLYTNLLRPDCFWQGLTNPYAPQKLQLTPNFEVSPTYCLWSCWLLDWRTWSGIHKVLSGKFLKTLVSSGLLYAVHTHLSLSCPHRRNSRWVAAYHLRTINIRGGATKAASDSHQGL